MSETIIERIEHHYKNDPDNMILVYPGDVLHEINNLQAKVSELSMELIKTRDLLGMYYDGMKDTQARAALLAGACLGLIEYRKRNTENFQLEKADDFINRIAAALTADAKAAAEYVRALEREHETAANITGMGEAWVAVEAARKAMINK